VPRNRGWRSAFGIVWRIGLRRCVVRTGFDRSGSRAARVLRSEKYRMPVSAHHAGAVLETVAGACWDRFRWGRRRWQPIWRRPSKRNACVGRWLGLAADGNIDLLEEPPGPSSDRCVDINGISLGDDELGRGRTNCTGPHARFLGRDRGEYAGCAVTLPRSRSHRMVTRRHDFDHSSRRLRRCAAACVAVPVVISIAVAVDGQR